MHNSFLKNYTIYPNGKIKSHFSGKFLSPGNIHGYLYVHLHDGNGNKKNFYVHRLVAQKFLPNPDNLPEVNHKNLDRSDNRVENLEWCSRKQNILHQHKYGNDIYTKERNKKISIKLKGRKVPQYVRDKIRKTLIAKGVSVGENNPMYGKHLTNEQIEKSRHNRWHKNIRVLDCKLCRLNES